MTTTTAPKSRDRDIDLCRMQDDDAPESGATDRGAVEFPIVIRPDPITLADLEARIVRNPDLVSHLREHPEFCATLARGVYRRDTAARERFADASTLAAHLQAIVAG